MNFSNFVKKCALFGLRYGSKPVRLGDVSSNTAHYLEAKNRLDRFLTSEGQFQHPLCTKQFNILGTRTGRYTTKKDTTPMLKLVYICAPFSADLEIKRRANILSAQNYALQLAQHPERFCPIVPHITFGWMFGLVNETDAMSYCLALLKRCDILVFDNPVEITRGMHEEIQFANKHKIPVYSSLRSLIEE